MSKLKRNYTIKKKLKGRCKIKDLKQTKKFKSYNKWTTKKDKENAIKYISMLNIPLLPNKKQVVIGTTKFLLPYFLNDKFNVFALAPKKWTLEDNNNLIHTIGEFNEPIVRLVTTPKNLIDDNNKIRITGLELCILFKIYNYEIYEYKNNTNYYGNIYFLIKKNNKIIIDNKYLKLINKKTKNIIYI